MTLKADSTIPNLFRRHRQSGDRWILKAKIKGSNIPITLTYGPCAVIPTKMARDRAKRDLALMYQGIDPRTQQRVMSQKTITLSEAISRFMRERAIAESTKKAYLSTLNRNFAAWMSRNLRDITGQECIDRYLEIRDEVASRSRAKYHGAANKPGESEAQKSIRTLHAIFSHYEQDYLPDGSDLLLPRGNPVHLLKQKRVRPLLKRRTTYLGNQERLTLLEWFDDAAKEMAYNRSDRVVRNDKTIKLDHLDWLFLILCTGLRFNEPLSMQWDDVNFIEGEYTIRETKNGNPLTLPMTVRTRAIFKRRKESSNSRWVFPQVRNPNKRATMAKVPEKISELSGINFTAHVLRRTASTVLAHLGFSTEEIGRVLNHTSKGMTDSYIQRTREMKRRALEELEACLFDFDDPPDEMYEEK